MLTPHLLFARCSLIDFITLCFPNTASLLPPPSNMVYTHPPILYTPMHTLQPRTHPHTPTSYTPLSRTHPSPKHRAHPSYVFRHLPVWLAPGLLYSSTNPDTIARAIKLRTASTWLIFVVVTLLVSLSLVAAMGVARGVWEERYAQEQQEGQGGRCGAGRPAPGLVKGQGFRWRDDPHALVGGIFQFLAD